MEKEEARIVIEPGDTSGKISLIRKSSNFEVRSIRGVGRVIRHGDSEWMGSFCESSPLEVSNSIEAGICIKNNGQDNLTIAVIRIKKTEN